MSDLPAAQTELDVIAGRPCLISRRFDRSAEWCDERAPASGGSVPGPGRASNLKYEQGLGPGFRRFRELLREVGRCADIATLVRVAVLNSFLATAMLTGRTLPSSSPSRGASWRPSMTSFRPPSMPKSKMRWRWRSAATSSRSGSPRGLAGHERRLRPGRRPIPRPGARYRVEVRECPRASPLSLARRDGMRRWSMRSSPSPIAAVLWSKPRSTPADRRDFPPLGSGALEFSEGCRSG